MSDGGGYSGTPLAKKLALKEGNRLVLVHAPEGWSIEDMPSGVRVSSRTSASDDVVVAFFYELATLRRDLPRLARSIGRGAALWAAWPRRAAGHSSDITDNEVRALALGVGLVDVKVAALGEDWSGLKLVRRKYQRTASL